MQASQQHSADSFATDCNTHIDCKHCNAHVGDSASQQNSAKIDTVTDTKQKSHIVCQKSPIICQKGHIVHKKNHIVHQKSNLPKEQIICQKSRINYQKSPTTYQKRLLIYQKSHIVCQKSPVTHPKHHTTTHISILPALHLYQKSTIFPLKWRYLHLGKEQLLKFWLKAELPSMGSQFSVKKALDFHENVSFLQSPTFPFEMALSTFRNRVALESFRLYGMIHSHM